MKSERLRYWRRILVGNLIAAAIVLFGFSDVTWRTPAHGLIQAYLVAMLFSMCIGPLVGMAMPKLSPWIWRRMPFPLNWIAVTAAMAAMAVAGSMVAIAVLVLAGEVPGRDFTHWFLGSIRIAITITLTIGLFITFYEMTRARTAQASVQAQLASLESRVQPHFLFNTLNSIAALIHDDPKGAERMTGQLASLLRSSLDQQATPLVALDEELKTVRDYLAIEQVRFGSRLRYSIDAGPLGSGARVPRLSIQTVVENSVKYAVAPRREGADLSIRAIDEPDAIRVTVEDNGPGFDTSFIPAGHGLALLRDRVTLLFGAPTRRWDGLRIDSSASGTRVTLSLPHTHDIAPPSAIRNPCL